MTQGFVDRGNEATLVALAVADPAAAWAAAGFTVAGGSVDLGTTAVQLTGPGRGVHGIVGWTLAGLEAEPGSGSIDGLPTAFVDDAPVAPTSAPDPHPNGIVGLDHVVVATPDLDRTIAAFEGVGLACRRIREGSAGGAPVRQAFFRVGSAIVEVVAGDLGAGSPDADAPARFFGLALDAADLDATAAVLGDGLGRVKTAVQRGRRIATLRHRHLGLSVAVAAMDGHGDR